MTRLILGLFLISAANLLSAQSITLTDADIGAVGSSYIMGVDGSLDSTFSIGGDGPNQSWDFSDLGVDGVDTVDYLDPVNTPYAADFPSANLSIYQADLDGYAYLEYDANSMRIIGLAGDPVGVGQTFIIPLEDPQVIAQFPFTYGSTLLDTVIFDITAAFSAFPGSDSVRYRSTSFQTLDGDSYGDLILPGGTHNSLRVKTVSDNRDSIWVHFPFIGWNLVTDSVYMDSSITWWANSVGYLLCEAVYDAGTVDQITYIDPVIVGQPEPLEVAFDAFPNPANQELTIRRENADPAEIQLFDAVGRLLRTVETRSSEVRLSVEDLPEGTYLLRIRDERTNQLYSGKILISH